MIKEALQYIIGLSRAEVQDVQLPDGTIQTYSDKDLQLLEKHIPKAEVITMHTLTSLLDYIKGNIDTMSEKMIVEVTSYIASLMITGKENILLMYCYRHLFLIMTIILVRRISA